MDRTAPTSVDLPSGAKGAELTPHDQRVVDLTLQTVAADARVRIEEIVARNRSVVATEISRAFETHDKLTTGRRVLMAVCGLAAFGLGFLVKGWIGSPSEDEPDSNNGVPE